MRKTIIFLAISISISTDLCLAQENDGIDQVVYLIGNTATRDINETHLTLLQEQLLNEINPFTILHLGDIVKPGQPDNWENELDLILSLAKDQEHGQVLFTPGDKDWNNSERDGLKVVRKLEKQIEGRQKGSSIFLPSKGYPGGSRC